MNKKFNILAGVVIISLASLLSSSSYAGKDHSGNGALNKLNAFGIINSNLESSAGINSIIDYGLFVSLEDNLNIMISPGEDFKFHEMV